MFQPHVQSEDLTVIPIEHTLSKLHPRFEFWNGKAHTGFLDGIQPVSMNIVDMALNFCNQLPYEKRIVKYFREHLWHELMLRYMHQGQHFHSSTCDQLDIERLPVSEYTKIAPIF